MAITDIERMEHAARVVFGFDDNVEIPPLGFWRMCQHVIVEWLGRLGLR